RINNTLEHHSSELQRRRPTSKIQPPKTDNLPPEPGRRMAPPSPRSTRAAAGGYRGVDPPRISPPPATGKLPPAPGPPMGPPPPRPTRAGPGGDRGGAPPGSREGPGSGRL